jgi:hypothetical protein
VNTTIVAALAGWAATSAPETPTTETNATRIACPLFPESASPAAIEREMNAEKWRARHEYDGHSDHWEISVQLSR